MMHMQHITNAVYVVYILHLFNNKYVETVRLTGGWSYLDSFRDFEIIGSAV